MCVKKILLLLILVTIGSASVVHADQYAFLVGVKQYYKGELKPLKYPENDVVAIKETLIESGYPENNIVLMTKSHSIATDRDDRNPNKKNISDELSRLLNQLGPSDTILVAFAGHGVQFQGEDDHFFCPRDAIIKDKDTLISLTGVFQQLENNCEASGKVLLVDACRNDPLAGLARSGRYELSAASDRKPPVFQGGTVAIFSCSKGQESIEDDDLQQGVFFYHVNQALSGEGDTFKDGSITFAEMEAYAKTGTRNFVRTNYKGYEQTPTTSTKGELKGNIVLIRGSGPAQEYTNDNGISFRLVPKGKFNMGSTSNERGRGREELFHPVEICSDFYIGKTEITQKQWFAVMKTRPWRDHPKFAKLKYADDPQNAASNISWDMADEFCRKLSAAHNRVYRLPTEAEWEYACRGKAEVHTAFCWGDEAELISEFAWCGSNSAFSNRFTQRVGEKKPNQLGLYDMHGNAYEWCNDWASSNYYKNKNSPVQDPTGPANAIGFGSGGDVGMKILRGGSCEMKAERCRSAHRYWAMNSSAESHFGFRLVLELGTDIPKKIVTHPDVKLR